jgi:hypothetical protein
MDRIHRRRRLADESIAAVDHVIDRVEQLSGAVMLRNREHAGLEIASSNPPADVLCLPHQARRASNPEHRKTEAGDRCRLDRDESARVIQPKQNHRGQRSADRGRNAKQRS